MCMCIMYVYVYMCTYMCAFTYIYTHTNIYCAAYIGIGGMKIEDEPRH